MSVLLATARHMYQSDWYFRPPVTERFVPLNWAQESLQLESSSPPYYVIEQVGTLMVHSDTGSRQCPQVHQVARPPLADS